MPTNDYDIVFHPYSQIDTNNLHGFKMMHLIRDPRDIVVSGCFYHLHSKEIWLHKAEPDFDGDTYHNKINSLQNIDDRLLFEMEHNTVENMKNIIHWDYNLPNCIEVKYEEIINDASLNKFDSIFLFLGFRKKHLRMLRKIVKANSIFSDSVKVAELSHVRSGKTEQWKNHFKEIHKKRFLELFGDILIKLGYEKDNTWASR